MTSATERLRALLDERGVEWEDCGNGATYVEHNGEAWRFDYDEPFDQLGIVCLSGYTPEQAVAATLGRGECRLIPTRDKPRSKAPTLTCSKCGWWTDRINDRINYCPMCGRRIVGD